MGMVDHVAGMLWNISMKDTRVMLSKNPLKGSCPVWLYLKC